ncbi:MAG: sensor histidine kinase [Cyanobium sp.]
MIPVSERFLSLLGHQLNQFVDSPELRSLVVYVTHQPPQGPPTLLPVGQWPADELRLPALDEDPRLRLPNEERRWLPLRHRQRLLGALQVESCGGDWSDPLRQRLQSVALCLTEALLLDLDQQALTARLDHQEQQLRLLVHQLRNPLTALRTFAQLLQRRLGPHSEQRDLVEGLLSEERQLNRYVEAISDLVGSEPRLPEVTPPQPLLLPPTLSGPGGQPLAELLATLLQRAAATADLAGRCWQGPTHLPDWQGDSGAVAEILANLLENAFRYSPPRAPLGLQVHTTIDGSIALIVWDGGAAIPLEEREAIFRRGQRGSTGLHRPGTGLGLALARDLARGLGGELELVVPPQRCDTTLPAQGNAFRLTLPPAPPPAGPPPLPLPQSPALEPPRP